MQLLSLPEPQVLEALITANVILNGDFDGKIFNPFPNTFIVVSLCVFKFHIYVIIYISDFLIFQARTCHITGLQKPGDCFRDSVVIFRNPFHCIYKELIIFIIVYFLLYCPPYSVFHLSLCL